MMVWNQESLIENFLTVTKRLPLKARVVLLVSLLVVAFELISGVLELRHAQSISSKILPITWGVKTKSRELREVTKSRELRDVSRQLENGLEGKYPDNMGDSFSLQGKSLSDQGKFLMASELKHNILSRQKRHDDSSHDNSDDVSNYDHVRNIFRREAHARREQDVWEYDERGKNSSLP